MIKRNKKIAWGNNERTHFRLEAHSIMVTIKAQNCQGLRHLCDFKRFLLTCNTLRIYSKWKFISYSPKLRACLCVHVTIMQRKYGGLYFCIIFVYVNDYSAQISGYLICLEKELFFNSDYCMD